MVRVITNCSIEINTNQFIAKMLIYIFKQPFKLALKTAQKRYKFCDDLINQFWVFTRRASFHNTGEI